MAGFLDAEAVEALGCESGIAREERVDDIVGKSNRARMLKQIELAGIRKIGHYVKPRVIDAPRCAVSRRSTKRLPYRTVGYTIFDVYLLYQG